MGDGIADKIKVTGFPLDHTSQANHRIDLLVLRTPLSG
jgi:hypothetical protein